MDPLGTALLSVVVAALSGGVFGALMGRRTARDQLALDARKHQDAMDEPKRQHRLSALQASVAALEEAINVLERFGDGTVYPDEVRVVQAKVRAGRPAVSQYGSGPTGTDYAAAEGLFSKYIPMTSQNKEQVIKSLQDAADAVHGDIAEV